MPVLRTPTHKQTFPEEFTGTSATQGIVAGDRVRSTLDQVSDGIGDVAGNTVDDHLKSLKSAIDNSGTDLSDITVTDRSPEANDAALERLNDGTIQFNRRLVTMLRAAQTASDVSTLIDTQVSRLVTNTKWKGEWKPSNYDVGDYVRHTNYYRCKVARTPGNVNGPAGDTDSWDAVTGTELGIVQRVQDVVELLRDRIQLTPAAANRGQWPARAPDGEGYAYHNPPMLWQDAWNNSTNYYFGAVVTHVDRLWTLTSAASRTTPKTGDPTAPGTDSDWSEVSIGHHLDIPHYQGDWADLGGHTFKEGDTIDADGLLYNCKAAYTRTNSSSHPSVDNQHWNLIDNWVGAIDASNGYHEGATGTFDGQIWQATEDVAVDDPEPGAFGNTKWRQITGATQADLDRLRTDLQNEFQSAARSRGPTVTSLPEPPLATSPVEVYLSRKGNRTFNAGASQIVGSSNRSESIGDEVGLYRRTTGPVNHVLGVVGMEQDDDDTYYGIFTRPEQDPRNTEEVGKFTHNPVGSAFIHAGVKQIGSGGDWGPTCLIKQNLLVLIGGGTQIQSFYLKVWDHAGTAQTPYHMNRRGRVYTIGNVNYQEMFGVIGQTAGAFKDIYDAGSGETDRGCELAIATTAAGTDLYIGNRTIAWRKETDVSESDSNLVFSEEIHTLRLIGQSVYSNLAQLPPNTAFFIFDDS